MEISGEDKLIINGEMFFCIRKYIRLKKSSTEIIEKIEELLKEGADINACDSNDNNNTILHIAAEKGEKDIVIYLLQKGANLFYNKNEKTAVDLASQTNTALGKEITEILCKQGKPAARITGKSSSKQQTKSEQNHHNKGIIRTDSIQEIKYPKRAGTSGVSGQFYETKLLSLVVYRALHDKEIEEFYLAANIKDIGDFDDVCFRYKDVACFMQTKHRENTDKAKLTVASVRSTTGKLGLGIYFDSFLKIRQKFSPKSTDPMFRGRFESIESYFVLYTPLKESFERKLSGNKQMCKKMHDIIYTSQDEINKKNKDLDMFQFDYEDRDLDFLTNFIKYEHMKVLAKTFLEFILSKNKLEVMMSNDLIKIYHPALAQKVLIISKQIVAPKTPKILSNPKNQNTSDNLNNAPCYIQMGMFRPDFFYSDDYNLITLKDTFYKEIVYTHSSKTELSKDEVKQKIQEIANIPCAETISTLIGSPIKFDDGTDKLILDINKLPKNKYKQDEIQQIRYDLQKIQVTRTMVKEAVYLAGQARLRNLSFELPQSFGNLDMTTNKSTKADVEERLDFLAGKFGLLINNFAEKNKSKPLKIIEISNDVVGPGRVLELAHLNSNGGIGGTVGNLLEFDNQSELFMFNTKGLLGKNAQYVLEKLKAITDEDLTNYRINVIIDGFPRVSFDTYKYDKGVAAEFLSKLWFYTNQAQEESVETTLKKEINKHYNADKQRHQFLFHVHSDAIFLRFHDEIQKWWKKQTEAPYLTKNTPIFEKAKTGIVDSPLLTVLNVMFIRKIKQLGVEFNENAMDCLNLHEFTKEDNNKILNIFSDAVILCAAKLMQSNKHRNNYSFINLDYVHILPKNDYQTMMEELTCLNEMILVIICETPLHQGPQDTLLYILNTYVNSTDVMKKQIIIITGEPLQIDHTSLFQNFDYVTLKDNDVNLINLTSQSQTFFLDKYTIIYQGQEVKLHTVVDNDAKELVNGKLLWSLLNKTKMEIGHSLRSHKYDEIENYYINRNLKLKTEEYVIGSLDDIDDKIVLISAKPCMGKTILLTHLALETKKIDPKPWIVLINMSIHGKDIEKIRNKNIKTIMTFLCNAALKDTDVLKKVNFTVSTENNREIVAINSKETEVISFELQLFINCYNNGNIIFLFDGFDKIYPQNTNEGIELFTALKEADKRMWITSDCYVIKILERQFGPSYKLDRLSTMQQKSFLQRFWTTNLKLEKLNHDQFNNITIFLKYIMKAFNQEVHIREGINDRPIMPLISGSLHIIYLTVLDYFQHEVRSISPRYLRETITKKWRLDSYTAVDRYLGRSIEEESLELAGTPLHLYIAANYFAFQITDKFNLHLDTQMIADRSKGYINAVKLYERFLKVNIKNICEIEDKTSVEEEQEKIHNEFFDRHKKLALFVLCKECDLSKILTEPEILEAKQTIKMIESGEMKTDLIESVVDGIPRFYHLLFAEYFIVETLADLLKRMHNFDTIRLESFWDFLVNIILVTSPRSLRNAFEYKLKYDPELAEVATNDNCSKIVFNLLLKQNHRGEVNATNTDNALNVAINEGLVNTTNFLLKGIRHNVNEGNVGRIMTILKSSGAILEAAGTSRSILSEDVLKCIQNVDGETITSIINSKDIGKDIQDGIKDKIVEPVRRFTNKLIEFSENNENLVTLVEQFPYHLTDFVRQFSEK